MSARLPTKAQFDALLPKLQAYARDWADRECTSFDAAVLNQDPKESEEDGSIWEMPDIDSKRVVSLLAEMEQVIGGGCKLPASVIKSGGYSDTDDLLTKLFPKLREKCLDTPAAAVATIDATSPAIDATSPAIDATSPAIDATSPAIDATSPAVDATSSAVDATSPAVDADSPAVDATSAAIDATSPTIESSPPEVLP